MRMYDLIGKKKVGKALTKQEIDYMITAFVLGEIPDYQMSAMLMAIYFKGMNEEELTDITKAMSYSGDMVDLSSIKGIKVDKHSTGGVGDKTTLIIAPIVAACGVKVAKMSGKGLGHTGGTIDKMESIPNLQTVLPREEFFRIVDSIGISIIGQSGNLAPADKKLYALRDVTATVDSIPLIAASIMSKKLAAGSDCILLDVTTGSGAFMKKLEDALSLAEKMVEIGEGAGKKTIALVTNMDTPLGSAIGNTLEIKEVIDTLKGNGPDDLTQVSLNLAANMLYLAEKGTLAECLDMAKETIRNGNGLERFISMVEAQGGDTSYIRDYTQFQKPSNSFELVAVETGYITHMNTEQCGIASMLLGAGRETKDSQIDFTAGIIINKKTGDYVVTGEILATLYSSSVFRFDEVADILLKAYHIGEEKPEKEKLIIARVSKEGAELFSSTPLF
jgi:pyrimidine-nucleoside phosphorylase